MAALLGALASGLVLCAACDPAPAPPTGPVPRGELRARLEALGRPNLVLIVVDTLRADWTTPYGFAEDTAPELARWAARGVVFERARAQSSWTKISMASLLTSLWPQSHAIRAPDDGLADSAVTVAEALQDAGYATSAVQTNGWLDQSFGFQQGFDRYMFPRGGPARRLPRASVWPHADRVHDEAVRLIETHDRRRPFFLYLHFMDVHEYASPPEFRRFGSGNRGAYLAAIRWVDDAVERVRKRLEAADLLERTVMVFASDHGETFGHHGVHGHARNVLTPVVWVPLVMRFPFPLEPVRVGRQVRNLDIAPTLLDLAGIPRPPSFEGESLLRLVTGEASDAERPSYAGLGLPLFPDASVQVSLNDGSWTYARNVPPDPSGAEFLYDRRVDPEENVNLIRREPAAAGRMRAALDAYLAREPAAVREEGVRIDPGIADRLRALGYLQ